MPVQAVAEVQAAVRVQDVQRAVIPAVLSVPERVALPGPAEVQAEVRVQEQKASGSEAAVEHAAAAEQERPEAAVEQARTETAQSSE